MGFICNKGKNKNMILSKMKSPSPEDIQNKTPKDGKKKEENTRMINDDNRPKYHKSNEDKLSTSKNNKEQKSLPKNDQKEEDTKTMDDEIRPETTKNKNIEIFDDKLSTSKNNKPQKYYHKFSKEEEDIKKIDDDNKPEYPEKNNSQFYNKISNKFIKSKHENSQISNKYDVIFPFETKQNLYNQGANNVQPQKTKMYDAIFSCGSIENFFKQGWDYCMTDKFLKRFEKENLDENKDEDEDKKFCPLCMLGDANKGKTFIANLLTDNFLDCGAEFKTIGISCKLSDFDSSNDDGEKNENEKYLLFDSAGRSEPLLIEPEEKKKLKDEELKETVESNNRDLKRSEEFMKNFLIKNSKIIIVVVNQLSLAEQIFLYELKKDRNYEELFIIHNLYNFKTRKDIEEYIDNTLINSIYFDIKKDYYDFIDENEIKICRPYYFREENLQNQDHTIIAHLILGNIETEDEWIKDFNKKTIRWLKNKMQICLAKVYFQVEKMLEKELKNQIITPGNLN